jgi:hypothetical protein
MANVTIYSNESAKGLEVAVRQFADDSPKCMLTITVSGRSSEIDIFTDGASLDAILDLGYAIVNAVNKIKYPNGVVPLNLWPHQQEALEEIEKMRAPGGSSLTADPEYVPFAINDADESAVTHDFRPGAYAINDAVEHEAAQVECEPPFSILNEVCGDCGKPATHKAYQQFLCKEHFDQIPF